MCEENKRKVETVTTGQFIHGVLETFQEKMERILKEVPTGEKKEIPEEIWIYGRSKGWLEEQDKISEHLALERRHAARIVHEFLRIECGIKDEQNWNSAKKLEDLYHCRVCAKHVAQVYVKGLMDAKTEKRFGLLGIVTEEEMQEILRRMKNQTVY